MHSKLIILSLAATIVACSREPRTQSARPADIAQAPETATSMETLLARFQKGTPEVDSLTSTSATPETLTRRYLDALAQSDSHALRDMHITRAEYAYLYFPESKMMAPPYELPPDVAWMLHIADSNKGIAKVIQRFGGQELQLESVRCPGDPLEEGANTVSRGCVVRYRIAGQQMTEAPLFAAIIEREGRLKFFSYATKL
jgi:hypothetical protein